MRILLLLMRFPYLINGAFTPPDGKIYFDRPRKLPTDYEIDSFTKKRKNLDELPYPKTK